MDTKKMVIVFVGLALLLVIYLFGTRYQMVGLGPVGIMKLNRVTGAVWFVDAAEETRITKPKEVLFELVPAE